MPLVFAGIVPHPPIAIPSIGKDKLKQIEKTISSFEKMEKDLYASKPDVIIFISPHGKVNPDAFTINVSDSYEIEFKEFGDFATKINIKGDTILITMNSEVINHKLPINIISEKTLDHGIGVPAYYLTRHLPDVSIIPVYFSLLDNVAHYEFGKSLKELIMSSDKRIAVLASGDLSHCLTDSAPLPFNAAGKEFDDKLINLLKEGDQQGIINMDSKLIEKAAECGYRSIIILLGVLNNIQYKTEVLSYEAPFGVGYLLADLNLN